MSKAVLQYDERWLKQRRKQLEPYLALFRSQLAHIFTIMPAPKRIYHIKTGEWEVINDPQWQELINKVTKQQIEYLKTEFPEFYHD